MSRSTLYEMSKRPKYRACIERETRHSTWWSTARLIAAGILRETSSTPPEVRPGPSFVFITRGIS